VTLQTTAVLLVPVTVALNCCCAPVFTCALTGETVIPTMDEVIDTVAVPDIDRLNRDVAVTVTVEGLGAGVGAV
jgi:hypothetical protein